MTTLKCCICPHFFGVSTPDLFEDALDMVVLHLLSFFWGIYTPQLFTSCIYPHFQGYLHPISNNVLIPK